MPAITPPTLSAPPGGARARARGPQARGRVTARVPMLGARGETLSLRVELPALDTAPPGMLYVPAGRFQFGGDDVSEASRQLLNTVPLHEVSTGAYYIGQHEVTFGE